MRVTVGTIVGLMAAGRSEAEVLAAYPYLESADIRAALALCGLAIRGEGSPTGKRLMRFLLDMNISPDLCSRLRAAGHEAIHWSSVGAQNARDEIIMGYAREHDQVVITHDLDFGAVLAITHATGPSVIQVRTEDRIGFSRR